MSPTVTSILQRPVTVIREIPSFPKSLSDFLAAQNGRQNGLAGGEEDGRLQRENGGGGGDDDVGVGVGDGAANDLSLIHI